MTPEAMALLHARAFADGPRPWSAAEFALLAAEPGVLVLVEPDGFAIGRLAGPEAELLTLAVRLDARRRGTGRALVAAFEAQARAQGAAEAFLEVAQSNTAARALYAGVGYAVVGERRGYVVGRDGTAVDALVLRKPLDVRDGAARGPLAGGPANII